MHRLLVWGLRQEGLNIVSAPLPSDTPRFPVQHPSAVIINCEMPQAECRQLVVEIRAVLPGIPVLDLNEHDSQEGSCGADGHVRSPYKISDVVAWMDGATSSIP
jgi:hypothetical protein